MTEKTIFPAHAKEAFSKEALERIAHTIADVEQTTHAEIRISIRDVRESGEADLSIREIAMKEFVTLGMDRTEGRTGILLLFLYDERKFYIYGDEGIHAKVDPETWDDVALTLQEHLRNAAFEEGVHQALKKVEQHLAGILPERQKSNNELSDDVVIT